MRKFVLIVTTLILIVSIGPAMAQEGPPEPVRVIASVLQLSEEQVGSWLPILQSRQEALQPVQQQLQANQEAIAEAMQSPAPDAQTIGNLFITRRSLEMNVATVSSDAAAQFEQLLTGEQRERLQQVRGASHVCPIAPAFAAAGLL